LLFDRGEHCTKPRLQQRRTACRAESLSGRHLACVGQVRRIKKAPLNRARHAMNRTDSDRAGLPVGLQLLRDQLRIPSACVGRSAGPARAAVHFFRGKAERHTGGSGAGARC
jgi:hypothetical protein